MKEAESWEVENARLLVEQTWENFKPAYDAMVLFFGQAFVSPFDPAVSLADTELVRCDACWMPLYRRRGRQRIVLTKEEAKEDRRSRAPVHFVVGGTQQFICCSNSCAAKVFEKAEPGDFGGGYPL